MDLVQVDLMSGTTRLTCWVEPRVRRGDQITLKSWREPARLWDVVRVGERRPAATINRGWNNNI